jgi:lysophospholipase L1-like esterase
MIKDDLCEIKLDKPIESFYIELKSPKDSITNFYGYSIENDSTNGIIYSSIGVNGAKFSDFIKTPNFWSQLKNIEADCVILSMGTNEAQNNNLDLFNNNLLTMVKKIKIMYPDAAIIITTPPISYYKKIKLNSNVNLISEIIKKLCLENNISYWDLYCIQEEIDHSVQWKNNKLLRPDLIHYSGDGYMLQANLFISAFQKSWFRYYHN